MTDVPLQPVGVPTTIETLPPSLNFVQGIGASAYIGGKIGPEGWQEYAAGIVTACTDSTWPVTACKTNVSIHNVS